MCIRDRFTSDSKWDSVKTGQIRIVTDKQSVAMDGKFNVDLNFCNITYVTTDANYSSLLIHLHNGLSEKRTVSKVHFIRWTECKTVNGIPLSL